MPAFFDLPIEIRFQIYKELRSFKSPMIKSPMQEDPSVFGYCSYGFQSRILETNRRTCAEAKEVFYGQNYWTFFASQRHHFNPVLFRMEPMALVLPFIRMAHIRFAMFHWLFWESCGIQQSPHGAIIQANVRDICLVLLTAPALRTVKIIWTETSTLWPPLRVGKQDSVRNLILEVVRPLIDLPRTCEIQRSNIMVAYRNGTKAAGMELDFSDCVDEVIALHRSENVS